MFKLNQFKNKRLCELCGLSVLKNINGTTRKYSGAVKLVKRLLFYLMMASEILPKRRLYNRVKSIRSTSNTRERTLKELAQAYVPHEVENNKEAARDYFTPPLKSEKPFSIILPPPNITGVLHLGHVLTVTIEDALVKWNRMRGVKTLWIPGMDHAGIATQVAVEKRLWKERRQTRHDLGRKLFEEEVWKWKDEKASIIEEQLRRLGASLDWSESVFTMDPGRSRAVTEAFIRLYESGLIYRSDYLVNWSSILQSAISDIEVEHLEISGPTDLTVPGYEKKVQFGVLTKFAYKFFESDDEIVVATTRPETMIGDVAVAVNPKDNRYSSFIGRQLWHPFRKEIIPIIADDFVDLEFGTGAVKVTPAHNQNDFEAAKRHGLNIVQIIDEKGNMNEAAGEFFNVPRFDARNIILDELDRLDLLRGRQDHAMVVPICGRSGDVIELLVKPQWFVRCESMARRAIEDVKEGRLIIDPSHFEKTWFSWLENIRDWCVSRQLWWGHRVPMYSCTLKEDAERKCWVAAENSEVALSKAALAFCAPRDNVIAEQDEDVLDTWFSSALLPFSALGWPQQNKRLTENYPLSLMETGHDILFFWVSRMVMLGTQLTGSLPFKKVLLHGIVCDAHGRKMSKSLGNVITPEDVVSGASLQDLESASRASHDRGALSEEELKRAVAGQRKTFPAGIPACGCDALRFTLCSHNIKNHFISFDVDECNTNRLFCNKIWQATKFSTRWFEKVAAAQVLGEVPPENLSKMDMWILSRLSGMVRNTNRGFEKNELSLATSALKNFLYYDFCDVYLESTKRGLRRVESTTAAAHCWTLFRSLDVSLRALAPFMPHLSRHLHSRLPAHPGLVRELDYPQDLPWTNEDLEAGIQIVLDAIVAVRRLKKLFSVTSKHKPQVTIVSKLPLLDELSGMIEDLAVCYKVAVVPEMVADTKAERMASDTVGTHATVHLTLPTAELKKAHDGDPVRYEKKRGKLLKQLQKMETMTSAENYKFNAPVEVQQGHARKIASLQEELTRMEYIHNIFLKM